MRPVYRVMRQHPARPEISAFDTTNKSLADDHRDAGWAVLELSAEVAKLFPAHGQVITAAAAGLRDEFAGLAMQAALIGISGTSSQSAANVREVADAAKRAGRTLLQHIAVKSFEMADAMLRTRGGSA